MKRILEWTAIVAVSVIALLVLVVYGVSEYRLRQTFDIPLAPVALPSDSAGLARGRHVFDTRGCAGCHGPGASGKIFFDEPNIARLVAPNVPRVIRGYTDPELARLLRHGVRPNGRGVAVMPSSMFYHLDDADLAALIAYLRTLPVVENDSLPATSIRALARLGLLVGQYKLEPALMVHDAPRAPNGPDAAARGRYLAMSSCTECHGQALEGDPTTPSPALSVVRAYSQPEFARLMREGIPRDGRTLDLMRVTARNRFSHWSDEEVASLYAFLRGES